MSLFSKNLRYLRRKGRYKQDEISNLFQKKANTIGNWENGISEPNLTELTRLGEFFKVSITDMLHTELEKGGSTGNKMQGPVNAEERSSYDAYKHQEPPQN